MGRSGRVVEDDDNGPSGYAGSHALAFRVLHTEAAKLEHTVRER